MEYNPRYPQPFSFSQAIDIALDPAVAWDEIARLRNSLLHLRRSQDELRDYLQDPASDEVDVEVSQAMKENEITIASQDERIFMLKLALTHHGHSVTSEQQMSESSHSAPSGSGADHFNSNGLDDVPEPVPVGIMADPETEERENGVYL